MEEFINLTNENIDSEHLCCIIRSKKPHPGVEAKRRWLKERIGEGHIFRKLNQKGCCFIEYAPLETAWVPVTGDNFYYIYCLWVTGEFKGKCYGKALLDYCISQAKANGKSGVCMLGAKRQKNWLSNQAFAEKYGFITVDETESGYRLLALSFDGSKPHFNENAKKERIDNNGLTVYYDMQCPYILQKIDEIKDYCESNEISLKLEQVDTLKKAKELPCVFNNFGAFYNGRFETVNLLDAAAVKKIIGK